MKVISLAISCLFLLFINLYGKTDPASIKFELLKALDKCNAEKIQNILTEDTFRNLEKTGNSVENIPAKVLYNCPPSDFCKLLPLLVEKGSNLNEGISSGDAILHRAVRQSNSIAVKCLVDNGADPKLRIRDGGRKGRSPIQLAKKLRRRKIYAILTEKEDNSSSIEKSLEKDNIDGFKVHFQKKENRTSKDRLLVEASKNGSLKIAKFLLEQGANPNHVEKYGYSAYFYAVSYVDVPMLSLLLDNQLNINGQNSNNNGPIAWLFNSRQPVSSGNRAQIINLLIENGLDKEACKKGFRYFKDSYGVYTKEDAIEHDRHLGGSDYVYVYDMLDSCKAPK